MSINIREEATAIDTSLRIQGCGRINSESLIAAIVSLCERVQGEWLPMGSAPQDSCWILGLTRTKRQVVVRWGGGAWEDDNRLCRDPVKWRPLPLVSKGDNS